jgi:hypothetical protein
MCWVEQRVGEKNQSSSAKKCCTLLSDVYSTIGLVGGFALMWLTNYIDRCCSCYDFALVILFTVLKSLVCKWNSWMRPDEKLLGDLVKKQTRIEEPIDGHSQYAHH